jgi:Undecaprenyl-phosphate galactose phosphotransferase WbaP
VKNHNDRANISVAPHLEVGGSSNATQEQAMLSEGRRERAWRQGLVILILVFSDLLFASLAWGGAFLLASGLGQQGWSLLEIAFYYMAVDTGLWLGIRLMSGLYPGYGLPAPDELRRQTYGTVATLAITTLFAFAFQSGGQLSRLLIAICFVERLLAAPLVRHFVKWALMTVRLWGKSVVVIGAGDTGRNLMQMLREEWGLGLRPISAFDFRMFRGGGRVLDNPSDAVRKGGKASEDVPYGSHPIRVFKRGRAGLMVEVGSKGGTVANALRRAKARGIDTAILAMPHVSRECLLIYVGVARRSFKHMIVIPDLVGVTTSAVTVRNLAGIFGVEVKHNLLDPWALRTKRAMDLAATFAGVVVLVPLLAVIALVVWVDSRGAILYWAHRMGKDEKHFSCPKFRTMVPNAEAKLERMLQEDPRLREEYLTYHKLRDDPRVTRVGRFLRKTSLDELPQLWNVLRGEMSLVGPRPYLPRESKEVGESQEEILRVPPGMTGPWQVSGRSHTSFEERVRMEDNYVRDWSVWLDLILLARTVEIVLFNRRAY